MNPPSARARPTAAASCPRRERRLADAACRKLGYDLVPDGAIRLSVLPEAELLAVRDITLAEMELAIEDGIAALA